MDRRSQLLEEIENLEGTNTFMRKGDHYLAALLPEILSDDEKIERVARGIYLNGWGLLIATDLRIFFIGKDYNRLLDVNFKDYVYGEIRSIHHEKNFIFGKIILDIHGTKMSIHQVFNDQAKSFCDYVINRSAESGAI